jgi:hypothetical protein
VPRSRPYLHGTHASLAGRGGTNNGIKVVLENTFSERGAQLVIVTMAGGCGLQSSSRPTTAATLRALGVNAGLQQQLFSLSLVML